MRLPLVNYPIFEDQPDEPEEIAPAHLDFMQRYLDFEERLMRARKRSDAICDQVARDRESKTS